MAEREEIAADLVWRYVEQVRDSGQPLSPVELQDLAELLATAGTVPGALTADEETCRLAVRRRVEQVLARHAEPAPPAPSERTPARPPVRPLLWPFRLATAATVALSLALATVGLWHQPKPVLVRVPRRPDDVQPIPESAAHEMMPRMVHNELQPQEERNLMWHLLVCPGCFEHYQELRHHANTPQLSASPLFLAAHNWQRGQE